MNKSPSDDTDRFLAVGSAAQADLKSILDRTDVRSRRDLVAQILTGRLPD
jgi:hypothetical protein